MSGIAARMTSKRSVKRRNGSMTLQLCGGG
jgi:hypothetical protein